MNNQSRRDFLKSSVAAGAAASLGTFALPAFANRLNVNDEIRVAIIGLNGRGKAHISGFSKAPGVRVVAFCDADTAVLTKRADEFEKTAGYKIDRVQDYRKVLTRDDVDFVAIATPNHLHALMTIEACQNGKHVYVEKPVCHNIWEGRKMVEAMQKYDRIVGAGFQNRSDKGLLEAIPYIHAGNLGKIKQVRGLCYRNRSSIGKLDKPLTPPSTVDYDLWLGPAADEPLMRPRFHYDWHWDFNTGNGDMGNQGPHEMDLVRWALGDPQHPGKVTSVGGRFIWNDAGNTPNMQIASFDFGNDIPVLFEVRNVNTKGSSLGRFHKGPGVGIIVTCENGEFRGGRGGGSVYDLDGAKLKSFEGDRGATHMQNYVDALRAGDASLLRSPLESAFYSSSMSHLANISVRTGTQTAPEEVTVRFQGNEVISEVFDRFSAQINELGADYKKNAWHLGSELQFDSETEQFTGGETMSDANGLIRRHDRKPFVIPESV